MQLQHNWCQDTKKPSQKGFRHKEPTYKQNLQKKTLTIVQPGRKTPLQHKITITDTQKPQTESRKHLKPHVNQFEEESISHFCTFTMFLHSRMPPSTNALYSGPTVTIPVTTYYDHLPTVIVST